MPSLADDVRAAATEAYGDVPNFIATMNAHNGAPGAVYVAADKALMDGLLTAAEQQAVLLAICAHHKSRYDSVAHARMGLDAGLAPDTVDRLLAGERPSDGRLQALVDATRQTCNDRGWLDAETVQDLEARGVSRGELYEIFALYGMKTFSSFVNHIADPSLDAPPRTDRAHPRRGAGRALLRRDATARAGLVVSQAEVGGCRIEHADL